MPPNDTTRPPPKPVAKVDLKAKTAAALPQRSLDDPETFAELQIERERTAALAAQLRALKDETARASAVPPLPLPVVQGPAISEQAISRAKWMRRLYQALGTLIGLMAVVTTVLTVHTSTTVPPKIENTAARTAAVEVSATTERQDFIDLRACFGLWLDYQHCVNGQERSAIKLGTGRLLNQIPETSVDWSEGKKPPAKAPGEWTAWVWKTETPCPAEPHCR